MHVALIIDEERLHFEHPMFNRISIGLIAEGVKLTRIVPDTISSRAVDAGEQRMGLTTTIAAPMKVLPWMKRDRRVRLMELLEKEPPDVLYAVGEEAWGLGMDLGRGLDRPVAIDVWSAGQILRVPRGRRAAAVASYVTPTEPIAEALRRRVDPALVCRVRIGVALPPEPRPVLGEPERAVALAVIGGGRDVPAYRSLLGGLSRVVRDMPQIQAFLELRGPNEHEIWRHARRLDLLENISTVADSSQHRSLLTRCDALLMPERYGEVFSLTLEAMAFGLPVILSNDPFLDMLVDGQTAQVVPQPTADEWARQIRRLITEPEAARNLGRAARGRVEAEHLSSDHLARLVDAFHVIAHGATYPFDPTQASK